MSHNERQHAYKAMAYVLKSGRTQPACRDDQSDTTTIPQRGAPLQASRSLVLYSSARRCSCIHATNFGLHSNQASHCIKGNYLLAIHHLAP